MGVAPRIDLKAFRERIALARERISEATLLNLRYLGEQCVNKARQTDTYKDVTGNLRSSIGYLIVRNGQVVKSNFERNLKKAPGSGRRQRGYGKDGLLSGQELARKLAKDYPSGWALIVVAGMAYAAKVESKGKDVLTSAEQYAISEMPLLLKKLNQSVEKMRL